MTVPVIELLGLARTYPGPPPVHALRPADLLIEAGDYVAVTGPSGSGKSTLLHYISTDVVEDGEFKKADRNWSACMAKNGFSSPDAETFWSQALNSIGQGPGPGQNQSGPPGPPTAAQDQAQIAMAVADADCTLSSDLAGIYFAVQANYEQQFVSANQQALGAGVREYKAAFAKALKAMPALLQTASATPNLPGPPRARHRGTVKPSPSHS